MADDRTVAIRALKSVLMAAFSIGKKSRKLRTVLVSREYDFGKG